MLLFYFSSSFNEFMHFKHSFDKTDQIPPVAGAIYVPTEAVLVNLVVTHSLPFRSLSPEVSASSHGLQDCLFP